MAIDNIKQLETIFRDATSDVSKRALFQKNREDILKLISQNPKNSQNLGKILGCLDPQDFPQVLNAFRKTTRLPFTPENLTLTHLLPVFSDLKTKEQAQAVCTYYSTQPHAETISLKLLPNRLPKEITSEIKNTVITHFTENTQKQQVKTREPQLLETLMNALSNARTFLVRVARSTTGQKNSSPPPAPKPAQQHPSSTKEIAKKLLTDAKQNKTVLAAQLLAESFKRTRFYDTVRMGGITFWRAQSLTRYLDRQTIETLDQDPMIKNIKNHLSLTK